MKDEMSRGHTGCPPSRAGEGGHKASQVGELKGAESAATVDNRSGLFTDGQGGDGRVFFTDSQRREYRSFFADGFGGDGWVFFADGFGGQYGIFFTNSFGGDGWVFFADGFGGQYGIFFTDGFGGDGWVFFADGFSRDGGPSSPTAAVVGLISAIDSPTAFVISCPSIHCTGQKIKIADIVDKYDALAPLTHSRAASGSRAAPLACLVDLRGCFESDQIHSEKHSWLGVYVFLYESVSDH